MKRMILVLILIMCLCGVSLAEDATNGLLNGTEDLCAAAYLGYGEDIGSVLRSEEATQVLRRYPFIATIPAMDTVVLPGHEVYCVVPAEGVTLVVEALDTWNEAYPMVYREVYRGTSPVLLIGNESDIMPNMQIRLLRGGQEVFFMPFISLRDGSFSAHGPNDGVTDFTLYPEGFVFEE